MTVVFDAVCLCEDVAVAFDFVCVRDTQNTMSV